MTQPVWITPAGSLGTISEGIFYNTSLKADAGVETVYFKLIAGQLPDGVQVDTTGSISGTPKNVISVQGVPQQVARDTTSKFAIRAYTTRIVNNITVVDRIVDRTFTITVAGQNIPEFTTPAGRIGTFYDGTKAQIKVNYKDNDPTDPLFVRLVSGRLPPGLVLSDSGLISGVIQPLIGPPGTALPGFDVSNFSEYPFDFVTRSASKNYQFSLEVTDGKQSNVRTFEIFVYSKDSMTADTIDFTADNTFITADVTPTRTPVLLNEPGSLGVIRANNYFTYKFDAVDFDGDAIRFSTSQGAGIGFDPLPRDDSNNGLPGSFSRDGEGFDQGAFSLPPNLQLDPVTGWLYGFIPDQGATEKSYKFPVRVYKLNEPSVISEKVFFTMTITGDIDTEVIWLTPSDLGVINNGAISTLEVAAVNTGGRSLEYQLAPGTDSQLPQGLSLLPSGHIVGRVSFNTFALDGGTTTFDKNLNTRLNIDETTFDLQFDFTVNVQAPAGKQIGYKVSNIIINNPGSGYTQAPTVTISPPPNTEGAVQATVGSVTVLNGEVVSIAIGNPGAGYTSAPTVTIIGGGGAGASAFVQVEPATIINAISVFRRFTITVNRAFNEPYQTLYIKAMPPVQSRTLITNLVQNQDLIPLESLYRADDPNFGVAKSVVYDHAYGLAAVPMADYVSSLNINHYRKSLTLGQIKTAQALDADGNVMYEVVYSEIIDNLVNNQGTSVGKQVTLPYPVGNIRTVYPNSLINMRNQVIDTVGQISPALPQWMLSKQKNGQVLGFTPAWVIAYVKPGTSGKIAYSIDQYLGYRLNLVDFDVDRYELDRGQTYNWNPSTQHWIPYPASETTFDHDSTIFDGGSVAFISPADKWTELDTFDKYLVFPRTNILG